MAKTVKIQPAELPKIRIAISTSVLFDMSRPKAIFDDHGEAAYIRHMIKNRDNPLPLGRHFEGLKHIFNSELNDVVVISRNNPITARRAIMTLQQHGVTPAQLLFTSGRSPVPYLKAYNLNRFLTTHAQDAEDGQAAGILSNFYDPSHIASAAPRKRLIKNFRSSAQPQKPVYTGHQHETVFDLDGVLFDQESERVFKAQGLAGYREHEGKNRDQSLNSGPAFKYLKVLDAQNDHFAPGRPPHIISIVTARGKEAAIRAIETLAKWGININGESHFLEGRSKTPILEIMAARASAEGMTIELLDDQGRHVLGAAEAGIFAGIVPGFASAPS
jgi:5'-nucleotidase